MVYIELYRDSRSSLLCSTHHCRYYWKVRDVRLPFYYKDGSLFLHINMAITNIWQNNIDDIIIIKLISQSKGLEVWSNITQLNSFYPITPWILSQLKALLSSHFLRLYRSRTSWKSIPATFFPLSKFTTLLKVFYPPLLVPLLFFLSRVVISNNLLKTI